MRPKNKASIYVNQFQNPRDAEIMQSTLKQNDHEF